MRQIWLFLSLALLVIGVQQTFVHGVGYSYWIFMFSLAFLFIYSYLKRRADEKKKRDR